MKCCNWALSLYEETKFEGLTAPPHRHLDPVAVKPYAIKTHPPTPRSHHEMLPDEHIISTRVVQIISTESTTVFSECRQNVHQNLLHWIEYSSTAATFPPVVISSILLKLRLLTQAVLRFFQVTSFLRVSKNIPSLYVRVTTKTTTEQMCSFLHAVLVSHYIRLLRCLQMITQLQEQHILRPSSKLRIRVDFFVQLLKFLV